MEIIAKFAGRCTKCGQRINVGEKIIWNKGVRGATHVKCPESDPNPNTKPVEIPVPKKAEFNHLSDAQRSLVITGHYHEGEYLSGYMVFEETATLIRLGIASEISGWGTHLEDRFVQAINAKYGENIHFTLAQGEDYALPLLEKQAALRFEIEMKKYQSQTNAFTQAKQTNQPVAIRKWSEDCNSPNEECNIDNLTEYALPDGSTKIERVHTY
jgi:hypothetical protein